MHKLLVSVIAAGLGLLLPNPAIAQEPMIEIYGAPTRGKGAIFLGCVNCNQYNSDALFNQFGTYGSQFSTASIYNRFGDYGGEFSDTSACNPRASRPPMVTVDGEPVGHLTVNNYFSDSVIDPRRFGACRY